MKEKFSLRSLISVGKQAPGARKLPLLPTQIKENTLKNIEAEEKKKKSSGSAEEFNSVAMPLPTEIIYLILSYLTATEKGNLMRLCKLAFFFISNDPSWKKECQLKNLTVSNPDAPLSFYKTYAMHRQKKNQEFKKLALHKLVATETIENLTLRQAQEIRNNPAKIFIYMQQQDLISNSTKMEYQKKLFKSLRSSDYPIQITFDLNAARKRFGNGSNNFLVDEGMFEFDVPEGEGKYLADHLVDLGQDCLLITGSKLKEILKTENLAGFHVLSEGVETLKENKKPPVEVQAKCSIM